MATLYCVFLLPLRHMEAINHPNTPSITHTNNNKKIHLFVVALIEAFVISFINQRHNLTIYLPVELTGKTTMHNEQQYGAQ